MSKYAWRSPGSGNFRNDLSNRMQTASRVLAGHTHQDMFFHGMLQTLGLRSKRFGNFRILETLQTLVAAGRVPFLHQLLVFLTR